MRTVRRFSCQVPASSAGPIPRVSNDLELFLEHPVAGPACVRHECVDHCNECGARYCVECADADRCSACAAGTGVLDGSALTASS